MATVATQWSKLQVYVTEPRAFPTLTTKQLVAFLRQEQEDEKNNILTINTEDVDEDESELEQEKREKKERLEKLKNAEPIRAMLWNEVYERGVVDMIMAYKIPQEYNTIIESHEYNWSKISKDRRVDDKFIAEFPHMVNWDNIIRKTEMTEEKIIKYKSYMNWNLVSTYQVLSLEFVKNYGDVLNHQMIQTRYKKMSVVKLKKECKSKGIRGYSTLRKEALIKLCQSV